MMNGRIAGTEVLVIVVCEGPRFQSVDHFPHILSEEVNHKDTKTRRKPKK